MLAYKPFYSFKIMWSIKDVNIKLWTFIISRLTFRQNIKNLRLVTFEPFMWGICMPTFKSLALLVWDENEVKAEGWLVPHLSLYHNATTLTERPTEFSENCSIFRLHFNLSKACLYFLTKFGILPTTKYYFTEPRLYFFCLQELLYKFVFVSGTNISNLFEVLTSFKKLLQDYQVVSNKRWTA